MHYPLDPGRYLLIGAIGAGLFAAASAVHEAHAHITRGAALARFIAASLMLALGIGMISGGIQHFSDIPARAATLIPLGIALSLVAFAVRDGHRLATEYLRRLSAPTAGVLLLLAFTLSQVADGMPAPAEGGHSHGATPPTGDAPAADDAHTAETSKTPNPAPATTAHQTTDAAATDHAADGHSHTTGK